MYVILISISTANFFKFVILLHKDASEIRRQLTTHLVTWILS